jgi:hypothetical protein
MPTTTTTVSRLQLTPLSGTEWRVSDPRRREDDALCLVGFVQFIGGLFEVTKIGEPRERHYFATMDQAMHDLRS